MSAFLRLIVRLPRLVLVGLVRAYQLVLSPHAPSTCRYQPTCSSYAIEALRTYGAVKGLILTVHRLGRCHPWGGHGYDPPRWFGEPPPDPPAAASHTPTSHAAASHESATPAPSSVSDPDAPAST